MSITATDVEQLKIYADGVMERAEDHAQNVKGCALAILGGIIWRADTDSIRIRQHRGNLANMLWIKIEGRQYALCYEHKTGDIEIRDGSQNGTVLHSLNDSINLVDIYNIVSKL